MNYAVYIVIMIFALACICWSVMVISCILYTGEKKEEAPVIKDRPKMKTTVLNGVKCKEDYEFYSIKTEETEICQFCKSTDIFSGATAPEYCNSCGASHMVGIWLKAKDRI